jgi:TrmH family RNA methyltransferase
LRKENFRTFGARVDGAIDYPRADYRGRVAIVLGSESEGLPKAWQAADITAIRLPMQGIADSLNVSATAAVLFYEAQRQRS